MKNIKRISVWILVVCILMSSCFMMFACGAEEEKVELQSHEEGAIYSENHTPTSKKAMIFIPGLMASALYNPETGENSWGLPMIVDTVLGLLDLEDKTTAEKNAFFDQVFYSIACDENQVPYTIQRVANMDDEYGYDAFGGMKHAYKILYPLYRTQYDMVVWQYDWRQHNLGAAEQLENFINGCGYEDVIFFTHSMGGVVVSNWLTRSQENRDKVELFMPFGAPLLGSMDAVTNLFSVKPAENSVEINYDNMGMDVINLMNGVDIGVGMFEYAEGLISHIVEKEFHLTDLTRNIATVYELLPFEELNGTDYYNAESLNYIGYLSSIYVDGAAMSEEQFTAYISSFDWSKKENGDLKPVIDNLNEYRNKFFYEVDNGAGGTKTVFVTELVPTEYVLGVGIDTVVGVNLSADGYILEKYTSPLGDGTVPAYSACVGLPLDHERVHLVNGIYHGPLMDNTADNPADETGLQYVLETVEKYIEYTDAEVLENGKDKSSVIIAAEEEENTVSAGKIIGIISGCAAVLALFVFGILLPALKKDNQSLQN